MELPEPMSDLMPHEYQADIILLSEGNAILMRRLAEAEAERDALKVELAALQHYAISVKAALMPFCAIKAEDGDAFNNYAPETIIRCEVTVGEIQQARYVLGLNLNDGVGSDAARKPNPSQEGS